MPILSNIIPIVVISALFLIGILLSWKLPSTCSSRVGKKPCLYCDCSRVEEFWQGLWEDK